MIRRWTMPGVSILFGLLTCTGCVSIPHLVWRQHDIETREVNPGARDRKVLIASRASDYKKALVERVATMLSGDSAYVKVRGLDDLADEEDVDSFDVVVLINTCMAWDMDRNVKKFLKRNPYHGKVVLLTTSAGGDWLPRRRWSDVDALSGASEMARVDEVAEEIVGKVRARMGS